MSKQTAVTLLFEEFRALSEVARKAGDEESANLIDFLCEREDVAKQMEYEQIIEAFYDGEENAHKYKSSPALYYNETFKQK